jgi:hypothetical protein
MHRHVDERLCQAVRVLAMSDRPLQERLKGAALTLAPLLPKDFLDADARRKFVGIMDDLTFDERKGADGRIAATVGGLSDDDARKIIDRILDLRFWSLRTPAD